MKRTLLLAGITGALLITGCKKNLNPGSDPVDVSDIKPVATDRGTPSGQPATATIGVEGGTITSSDGHLSVIFPAGALTENTEVGIQPVSNNSPLGLGLAYRLSPEGKIFAKPVALSFHYDTETLGSAVEDFLWFTTQNADGTWSGARKTVVDKTAKTVTVDVPHFSDWSLGRFIDLVLIPNMLNLPVGKSIEMPITGFLRQQQQVDEEDVLAPLAPVSSLQVPVSQLARLLQTTELFIGFSPAEWALNGAKAPLSNDNGRLEVFDNEAKYTAPDKRPSPATVAVSVRLDASMKAGQKASFLLVSNITIVDGEYYLKLTSEGKDYIYYEYGINGKPIPDDSHYEIVNFARNDDGSLALAGTYVIGGSQANVFLLTFDHRGAGSRSLFCNNADEDNHDKMSFSPDTDITKTLINGYSKRTKNGDVCDIEDFCAGMNINVTEVTGDNGNIITAKFSGELYSSLPGSGNKCISDEPHSFSGEFHLQLVN